MAAFSRLPKTPLKFPENFLVDYVVSMLIMLEMQDHAIACTSFGNMQEASKLIV